MLFLFTIDSEEEMIAFSVGPINVYRYGIMYLLSFVLGYIILKRGQKQGWYLNTHADLIIRDDLDGLMTAILI